MRRNVEKYENYYHTIFYVLLRLLGMDTEAEYHTSEGSIDIVIKTKCYIYIIELKINGSAKDAMNQIHERSIGFQPTCAKRRQANIDRVAGVENCESAGYVLHRCSR